MYARAAKADRPLEHRLHVRETRPRIRSSHRRSFRRDGRSARSAGRSGWFDRFGRHQSRQLRRRIVVLIVVIVVVVMRAMPRRPRGRQVGFFVFLAGRNRRAGRRSVRTVFLVV